MVGTRGRGWGLGIWWLRLGSRVRGWGLNLSPRLVLRAWPPVAPALLVTFEAYPLREQTLGELRPAGENRELFPAAAIMEIGM